MFGRRRASFSSLLCAPLPEDAPPGGGGGPAPINPLPDPGPQPKPPAPPIAAPGQAPALTTEEIMRRPDILALLDRRIEETDKRARTEAEKKVRDELAEQSRLAQLSVEDRARQEAATAKGAATKAENAANEARAENVFLRSLLNAGLQPHDDDCMAMAWLNAKRMAGEGQPVTAETLAKLRAEKPHLFKSSSSVAAAPTAPTNPAEVLASRSLTTQPAKPAGGGSGPTSTPENAFDMSKEEWEAFKKKHGPHGR